MAKRDDACGIGGTCIQPGDVSGMAADLQNNNPDALTFVGARGWAAWSYGTAAICVFNDYYLDNTHLSRWEAGWVTGFIGNECGCNGSGTW